MDSADLTDNPFKDEKNPVNQSRTTTRSILHSSPQLPTLPQTPVGVNLDKNSTQPNAPHTFKHFRHSNNLLNQGSRSISDFRKKIHKEHLDILSSSSTSLRQKSSLQKLIRHSISGDQYQNSNVDLDHIISFGTPDSHFEAQVHKHPRVLQLSKDLLAQRKSVTIFKKPLLSLYYFSCWALRELSPFLYWILPLSSLFLLSFVTFFAFDLDDKLLELIPWYYIQSTKFVSKWLFLGFLSSAGLGMGLHTFFLNLAPYTVQATMIFHEHNPSASIISIWFQVWPAAFLWGVGTSLGELSSYFIARAARRLGKSSSWLEEIVQDAGLKNLSTPNPRKTLFQDTVNNEPLNSFSSSVAIQQEEPMPSIRRGRTGTGTGTGTGIGVRSNEDFVLLKVASLPEIVVHTPPENLPTSLNEADHTPSSPIFESLQIKTSLTAAVHSKISKIKKASIRSVARLGFPGILLLASIPNPLFDLAGLTAGYLLMDIKIFFFATLIGKSFIKAQIQTLLVIFLFSPSSLRKVLNFAGFFSIRLQRTLQHFILAEKSKLGILPGSQPVSVGPQSSTLSTLFNLFSTLIVFYFVLTMINSVVEAYLSDLHEHQVEQLKQELSISLSRESTPRVSPLKSLSPDDSDGK